MVAWQHKSVLSDISFQWYSPCRAFYPKRCTTQWPSWPRPASVGSAFSPSRWFSHSDLKKHISQSAYRHWNLSLWSLLLTRPVAGLKGELHYGDKNSGGAVCISPGPRVGGWSVFFIPAKYSLITKYLVCFSRDINMSSASVSFPCPASSRAFGSFSSQVALKTYRF